MAKTYWLPTDDDGKDGWLSHFATELPAYKTTIGVADTEATSVAADAAYFTYVLAAQKSYSAAAEQWTAFKKKARNGTGTSMGTAPVPPTLGTAPAAVAPGIFKRITLLVGRIKKHPGYTEDIGRALKIVGAEITLDFDTLKPLITVELQAGKPVVVWKKQGLDGVEIHVDRGDGKGFILLTIDTNPDYTDTFPLPVPGQTALWKYKAIYLLADERVGQWSDVATIAVQG